MTKPERNILYVDVCVCFSLERGHKTVNVGIGHGSWFHGTLWPTIELTAIFFYSTQHDLSR